MENALLGFRESGTLLVGIGYKSRQGKTTFAECLQDLAPQEIAIWNTSDFIVPVARWLGMMKQEKDGTALQLLAELMIRQDPDFLCRQFSYGIRDINPKIAVLAGIRDKRQFDWIKANSGVTIKLERTQPDGRPYQPTDRIQNHFTETELDREAFDYIIHSPESPTWKINLQIDAKQIYEKLRLRLEV